nr:structural protein [Tolivirales sp.]
MVRKGRTRVVIRAKKKQSKQRATNEVSALGRAIRSLGLAAGGAAGTYIGQPAAGGAIGHSLGAALSQWLGAGDYAVGSNTVVKQSMKAANAIPVMHTDQQSVVIRHREYLGEVLSSTAFTVQQTYPLNPGNSTTFPWLCSIAASFQEYRIRGIVFHYVPTSGAAISGTNAALGSVMLQTSYRSNDALPTSKVEMLNEFWSNEVVPSDTMAHPIECDPKENPFNVQYIRTGTVPSGDSVLMYDLGQTHLAVSGCQSNGARLGDLWVTYDVELKKPLLYSNVTSRVDSANGYYSSVSSLLSVFGSTVRTLNGPMAVTTLNNTMTFPKGAVGKYFVLFQITGTALSLASISFTNTNLTYFEPVEGAGYTNIQYTTGSTVAAAWIGVQILDPAVQPTLTVSFAGSGSAYNTAVVSISQIG